MVSMFGRILLGIDHAADMAGSWKINHDQGAKTKKQWSLFVIPTVDQR